MNFKLFSDLIDALGKVVGGFKALVNLPKAERDKYRQTMEATYLLMDTTLNMVIIRLGDILREQADSDFLREASGLDNSGDWLNAEREFRLCRSLRVALSETNTLAAKLVGSASVGDWNALLAQMQSVLATEGEVAAFISERFHELAGKARMGQIPSEIRTDTSAFRDALVAERQKLIQREIELYSLV